MNVRLVGDSVSPALPLAARDTVTFEAGADDSARVNVPLPPWVTLRLAGVAVIVPPLAVPPAGVQVTVVGAALVPE